MGELMPLMTGMAVLVGVITGTLITVYIYERLHALDKDDPYEYDEDLTPGKTKLRVIRGDGRQDDSAS